MVIVGGRVFCEVESASTVAWDWEVAGRGLDAVAERVFRLEASFWKMSKHGSFFHVIVTITYSCGNKAVK